MHFSAKSLGQTRDIERDNRDKRTWEIFAAEGFVKEKSSGKEVKRGGGIWIWKKVWYWKPSAKDENSPFQSLKAKPPFFKTKITQRPWRRS